MTAKEARPGGGRGATLAVLATSGAVGEEQTVIAKGA